MSGWKNIPEVIFIITWHYWGLVFGLTRATVLSSTFAFARVTRLGRRTWSWRLIAWRIRHVPICIIGGIFSWQCGCLVFCLTTATASFTRVRRLRRSMWGLTTTEFATATSGSVEICKLQTQQCIINTILKTVKE